MNLHIRKFYKVDIKNVGTKQRGVSLMEILVALLIVGILAGVAFPAYQDQAKRARRADAQNALLGLANAMQRYHTTKNTYVGAALPTIYPSEIPVDGSVKFYDLSVSSLSASAYVLKATPKNGQAGDGFLQYTSAGLKSWDQNNNDAIDTGETNNW